MAIRFARTGEGQLRRISPNDPRSVRLITPRAVVLLYIDEVIHVGRIFWR